MGASKSVSPLVSIVLPVYNGENTIASAIRSILHQDYANWELIVIDDGSSDESASIVLDFVDPRITLVRQTENRGISAALNCGVSLSEGEFIMRMDDDDVCFPERISVQVDYMNKHPCVDLIGSRCLYFDGKTQVPMGVIDVPETHSQLSADKFSTGFVLAHPSLMGRRQWFREFPYRTEYDGAEDRELLIRAANCSTYGCVPEVLLAYRVGKSNLRSSLFRRFLLVKAVQEHGNLVKVFWVAVRQISVVLYHLFGLHGRAVGRHWHLDSEMAQKWDRIREVVGDSGSLLSERC